MHLKYAIHWMRRMKRRPRCLTPMSFAGLLCAATLSVAEPPAPADLILTHGHIHTGNAAQPWAEAVAVAQGRIIDVGTNAPAEAVAGAQTRRVDLQGQFAMAGLIDDHVHPVMGGLKLLYECNFPFSSGPEDVARAVGRCAASAPPGAWIRGGRWDSGFFDTHPVDEPRRLLDAVSGDHPVMLVDDSEHNGWVNSRALQLAGIDAGTADPPGGRIVRDAAGSPNGVLLESAFRVLFKQVLPAWTPEQHVAAVREAVRRANAVGITAFKDAGAYEEYLAAYNAVDAAGDLTLHVAASLRTPSGSRSDGLDYAALNSWRRQKVLENRCCRRVKDTTQIACTSTSASDSLGASLPALSL